MCSTDKDAFESIEFLSYTYRYNENEDEAYGRLKLLFYEYVLIEKNGEAYVCSWRKFDEKENTFYKTVIDKQLIDSLLQTALNYNQKQKQEGLDSGRVMIYDGPSLKIRINYKNGTASSFNFIDDENKDDYYFIKLHHLLKSMRLSENNVSIKDTINLWTKQSEFEKYSINDDTTNHKFELPPPPPPLNKRHKVKFNFKN